LISSNITTP